jgi:hypothetical protein
VKIFFPKRKIPSDSLSQTIFSRQFRRERVLFFVVPAKIMTSAAFRGMECTDNKMYESMLIFMRLISPEIGLIGDRPDKTVQTKKTASAAKEDHDMQAGCTQIWSLNVQSTFTPSFITSLATKSE